QLKSMIVGVKYVAAEVIRTNVGIDTCCRPHTGDAPIVGVNVNDPRELSAPGADILGLEHPAFGKFPLQAKVSLLVVRRHDVLVHMPRVRHHTSSPRKPWRGCKGIAQ